MEPNTTGDSPSPEDGNRSSFQNVMSSGFLEHRKMTKSKNQAILGVIHHRQNPLEIYVLGKISRGNKSIMFSGKMQELKSTLK
jgi:hypothetical protein